MIRESPLLGYGFQQSFHVDVGRSGFWADHAHNHYLQQFIQGGVIQFIAYLLLVFKMCLRIYRVPIKQIKWGVIVIFVTGIMLFFESYTNVMIYSVIYIVYGYCDDYLSAHE